VLYELRGKFIDKFHARKGGENSVWGEGVDYNAELRKGGTEVRRGCRWEKGKTSRRDAFGTKEKSDSMILPPNPSRHGGTGCQRGKDCPEKVVKER
jgi:hypothetical protein